jgi:hypothetical protein
MCITVNDYYRMHITRTLGREVEGIDVVGGNWEFGETLWRRIVRGTSRLSLRFVTPDFRPVSLGPLTRARCHPRMIP